MKKIIAILLLTALLPLAALSAESSQDVFPDLFLFFLSKLIERHEELKTIAMPDFEIHTLPDVEDEAIYVLTFNTQNDYEHFLDVLGKENIPYGTFPDREQLQLMLFYSDFMVFIFRAAIGL